MAILTKDNNLNDNYNIIIILRIHTKTDMTQKKNIIGVTFSPVCAYNKQNIIAWWYSYIYGYLF